MNLSRRKLLQTGVAATLSGALASQTLQDAGAAVLADDPIVDTHQHLWDLNRQTLPWLSGAPEILRKTYSTKEYAEATRDLNVVKAIYMEVNVEAAQHVEEAERIVGLCRDKTGPTVAAVIGGRPASPGFGDYLKRFRDTKEIKGVRQVLHSTETPAGYCLKPEFIEGVRLLGKSNLIFDVCMRPGELADGVTLAKRCPDTRLVIDHCGNGDPLAFRKGVEKPPHDPDAWKRGIDDLARQPNTIIKISGIIARAPKGWTADDLAPIVNHCLDAFGPDRAVFGGDWPVCLLGSETSYRAWVTALRSIIANRPKADQRKLWHDNAVKFYGV